MFPFATKIGALSTFFSPYSITFLNANSPEKADISYSCLFLIHSVNKKIIIYRHTYLFFFFKIIFSRDLSCWNENKVTCNKTICEECNLINSFSLIIINISINKIIYCKCRSEHHAPLSSSTNLRNKKKAPEHKRLPQKKDLH